jgi:hypothetical protein
MTCGQSCRRASFAEETTNGAGTAENCVTTVFSAYVTANGQAWADCDVYMPARRFKWGAVPPTVLAPRRVLRSTPAPAGSPVPGGPRAGPRPRSRGPGSSAAESTAVSTSQIATRSGTAPATPARPADSARHQRPTPRSPHRTGNLMITARPRRLTYHHDPGVSVQIPAWSEHHQPTTQRPRSTSRLLSSVTLCE